jgi:hypothetical protein
VKRAPQVNSNPLGCCVDGRGKWNCSVVVRQACSTFCFLRVFLRQMVPPLPGLRVRDSALTVQSDLKKWVFEISLSVQRFHQKFEGEKVINVLAQIIKV